MSPAVPGANTTVTLIQLTGRRRPEQLSWVDIKRLRKPADRRVLGLSALALELTDVGHPHARSKAELLLRQAAYFAQPAEVLGEGVDGIGHGPPMSDTELCQLSIG